MLASHAAYADISGKVFRDFNVWRDVINDRPIALYLPCNFILIIQIEFEIYHSIMQRPWFPLVPTPPVALSPAATPPGPAQPYAE